MKLVLLIVCALTCAAFLSPTSRSATTAANEIQWQASFEKTLENAQRDKKVVFLAVNMDGEKANERTCEKVYTDKAIIELSQSTLNLIASAAEHAGGDKKCPRFAGLTCLDHRKTDTSARKELLKADADGFVVAPQHVFLDSNGKVLLSVPFEVSANELTWCFVTALTKGDPTFKGAMPASARMPRRVVIGGVFDPKSTAGGSAKPLTHKELVDLVKEVRKGTLKGEERWAVIRRILSSDDKEAIDFITEELRGGGGGGGKFGGGRGDGGEDKHKRILHAIGIVSPPAYWKVAADFLGDSDTTIRGEAAVAIEQLATPEALKELQSQLQTEKDVAIQKELLRALGTCGASDAKVRAALAKRAKSDKIETLRLNALIAIGSCDADPETRETLTAALDKGSEKERTAAVLAMALTRDETWIAAIEAATKGAKDENFTKACALAIEVLKGGSFTKLRAAIEKIAEDTIPRERTFGRAQG